MWIPPHLKKYKNWHGELSFCCVLVICNLDTAIGGIWEVQLCVPVVLSTKLLIPTAATLFYNSLHEVNDILTRLVGVWTQQRFYFESFPLHRLFFFCCLLRTAVSKSSTATTVHETAIISTTSQTETLHWWHSMKQATSHQFINDHTGLNNYVVSIVHNLILNSDYLMLLCVFLWLSFRNGNLEHSLKHSSLRFFPAVQWRGTESSLWRCGECIRRAKVPWRRASLRLSSLQSRGECHQNLTNCNGLAINLTHLSLLYINQQICWGYPFGKIGWRTERTGGIRSELSSLHIFTSQVHKLSSQCAKYAVSMLERKPNWSSTPLTSWFPDFVVLSSLPVSDLVAEEDDGT